jgi:hypothetical protein
MLITYFTSRQLSFQLLRHFAASRHGFRFRQRFHCFERCAITDITPIDFDYAFIRFAAAY